VDGQVYAENLLLLKKSSIIICMHDIILISIAAVLLIIALIGCIIPGIPGTPLAWAALLLAHFTDRSHITWVPIIIMGVITVAVEILNNFVPSMFTQKAGGSKAGSIGSTIGVFAGVFLGSIVTILLGPLVGAFIGELIHDRSGFKRALKSAVFSFLGFLSGSGLRLITSAVIVIIYIKSFF